MKKTARKEVLKKIRDGVLIDCDHVYSDRRKKSQHHKFYNCAFSDLVVGKIKKILKENDFLGITVNEKFYNPAEYGCYGFACTSVSVDFPYDLYK